MIADTHRIADHIVFDMSRRLADVGPVQLPTIRSVFIVGSWARGDWLNSLSDLDIKVLYHPHSDHAAKCRDLTQLKDASFGGAPQPEFASRRPGGIHWGTETWIPLQQEHEYEIWGNPYYSVFYFDFFAHRHHVWGEDFSHLLPDPVDTRSLLGMALQFGSELIDRLPETEEGLHNIAGAAYRSVLMTQLAFGEQTLDKTRLLDLYLRNVPRFPMKPAGEFVIRQYLGAVYPDYPPAYGSMPFYSELIGALRDLVSAHCVS